MEFLAVEGKNRDYIRTRRAYILKYLKGTKSFRVLIEKLRQLGFQGDEKIIETDLEGLNTFGIRINKDGNAVDGRRNRDFEIITAELFKKVYGLQSIHLGGGRKPDGMVFTNTFGIIIDTKAYGEGYSKNISQADEMIRYIEDNQRHDTQRNSTEWWSGFDKSIPQSQFYYLWISSKFIGRFQEQLDYTSSQTNTNGGALNVVQLLLGADAVLKGNLDANNIPDYISNQEIKFASI